MRKSIYLLTTTHSSHTHRFHPLPLATPTSCSPHPLATPIHSTHSPQLSSILLTLSRATSHYCTTRAPLERATSHYCSTGSRGLFTAYLDLLVLRFSVHCSSAASLYILFHHHVYIFTYVSVAVRKTCLFVPRTCCDSSTCSWTTQKRLHMSSKAI